MSTQQKTDFYGFINSLDDCQFSYGENMRSLTITPPNGQKIGLDIGRKISASVKLHDVLVSTLRAVTAVGHCHFDIRNPCWGDRSTDAPGKHWAGGAACPHCTALGLLSLVRKESRGEPWAI